MLWSDFLLHVPPNKLEVVEDLFQTNGHELQLTTKDVKFFCNSDKCKGERLFHLLNNPSIPASGYQFKREFLTYWCNNCKAMGKVFSVSIQRAANAQALEGQVMKYGEDPPFGPAVPSRLISLIGPDRELFLQGRRAESQGLGVGAFAYYRRVVENEKGRLIGEILKVAKRLNATQEVVDKFNRALNETQFSRAVDDVKNVIPPVLLIDGHNPLMLLHSALSEGLHAGTDKECLELATSIRLVLTELSERLSTALNEEKELKAAISRLLNRSNKPAASVPENEQTPKTGE